MEYITPKYAPNIGNASIRDLFDENRSDITRSGVYVAQVKEEEEDDIYNQIVKKVRENNEYRYF